MNTCLCRSHHAQCIFLFLADAESNDAMTPKERGMAPGQCAEELQWVCGGSGMGGPSERAP